MKGEIIMRMIITKDKAINIDYITALEIEVNFSEYNLETGKVEKVANPVGYLWAKTTAGSHIIKVVRDGETEEEMHQELKKVMNEIISKATFTIEI